MNQQENNIRDKLIKRLDLFDNNTQFLDKEKYLPNKLGTKGFVDIFAKDALGRYVLIEIKRSKATSREALHEVLKYYEGVKENMSLKDDELLVIIISTIWDELIVPYSSFVKRVNCPVIGYELSIDGKNNPISIKKVVPLVLNNDRFICDQHFISLYTSTENLQIGKKSYIECYEKKGIQDYVLLLLKAPSDLYNKQIEAMSQFKQKMDISLGIKPTENSDNNLLGEIPNYKYMIYSAEQVMSTEDYWRILKQDKEAFDEIRSFSDDYEEDELMHSLHEYAIGVVKPQPYSEYSEIAYPAKLSNRILKDEGWQIIELIRGGRLKTNKLLSDDSIISELCGVSGTNKQYYKKSFSSKKMETLTIIKKEISVCLVDNPIWRVGIEKALDYIEKSVSTTKLFSGKIMIFNPSNTIYYIYLSLKDCEVPNISYIPNYYILVEGKDIHRMYFGCLVPNGKKPNLNRIIKEHYSGDLFSFFFPLTWGGYEQRDVKIASEIGLEYVNILCEINGSKKTFFKYNGYEYESCQEIDPFIGFFSFIKKEKKFVSEVVKKFQKHLLGSLIQC